ncbi:serine/threonine-protein kinase [Crateriforma conspicua]|uniref:Serine/threonine-protein kinase PrkC n=1 Tax=Crateriforma conspicua TaxID=2527996 RepID=A0A5C6G2R5_9PLAN|nr:serine/threonine-protein kinase [Crateriforma conspicua]TWU67473.1 Serine/threonine-protein kinase PrkC [Crateriforma conspicua]
MIDPGRNDPAQDRAGQVDPESSDGTMPVSDDSQHRHPVDLIAEDFAMRIRQGERPDIESFAASHPEHADILRQMLPSIEAMEKLNVGGTRRDISATTTGALSADDDLSFHCFIAPETIGDFRIVRQIARGGMGVVYEAVQESLGRHVALKVMSWRAADHPSHRQRFQREAEAIAGLHHTNIVAVYGVGQQDDLLFYAMHLVDGVSLADLLAGTGPDIGVDLQNDRQTAAWIATIADALQYAHGQGVLHRDIKPANLMVDRDHHVWLTDFGLAADPSSDRFTQTGEIVGTLRYMAPEQLKGHLDVRSDVYCLGLTLYELLTGRAAIQGTPAELLSAENRRRIAPPRSLRATIPSDLQTIVMKAVSEDPTHRYATAGEFRDDLQRFLAGRPIAARRVGAMERSWRWAKRNPGIASLSGTVLVLLLSVITLLSVINRSRTRSLTAIGKAYDQAAENLRQRSAALDEAERARESAVRERSRAETNLSLALSAFQEIVDNVAGRTGVAESVWESVGDDLMRDADSGATLGDDDVQLMENLLQFFEKFADENATDLRMPAADARRSIGDILFRLGRPDEARESYDQAWAIYSQLRGEDEGDAVDSTVPVESPIAVAWGQMRVAAALRRPSDVRAWLQRCRQWCFEGQAKPATSDLTFLWAKSLRLAGSLTLSTEWMTGMRPSTNGPGPGPDSLLARLMGESRRRGPNRAVAQYRWHQQCSREAIQWLEVLLESDPQRKVYAQTLAAAHQDIARQDRMRRDEAESAKHHRDEAIRILDDLSKRFPDDPDIQYQFADTLASAAIGDSRPVAFSRASDDLRQSIRLANELVRKYPDSAEYQSLQASVQMKLAISQYAAGRGDRAQDMIDESLVTQRRIVQQHPDVPMFRVALAQSLWSMADLQRRQRKPVDALRSINEAIETLESDQGGRFGKVRQAYLNQLRQRRQGIQNTLRPSPLRDSSGNDASADAAEAATP